MRYDILAILAACNNNNIRLLKIDKPQLNTEMLKVKVIQSINQSLFQAEAHRTTNNKENANTGNRTEQTHRRIQVKKK